MHYCKKCARYFESAKALKQHREASSRHAVYVPYVKTTTSTRTMSSAFPLWGTEAALPRDEEPFKILMSSLVEFYSNGEYSDLVISCGEKEYRVHRILVCAQSKFFAAACREGFKEAQEREINLQDCDPWLVHIMVHYFYHLDYDVRGQSESGHFDGSEIERDSTGASEPTLVTHAKVYAFAEQYLIDGLKRLALRKFKMVATQSLDVNDFLQAAQEVYTSTIEEDRGLRDIVVETLFKHPAWLDENKVQYVIKEMGALTFDLIMYIRQQGRL
ncbi:BTB/POZ protein [Apodospora peruviana]|uniref:BTB/POZ protein n=1 Tax=Apodospora peruviana TaxID=516989 RepID=A0AAE0IUI5_9PEZI|nr:BTB/POZ protein [Apodospora peruviana]